MKLSGEMQTSYDNILSEIEADVKTVLQNITEKIQKPMFSEDFYHIVADFLVENLDLVSHPEAILAKMKNQQKKIDRYILQRIS